MSLRLSSDLALLGAILLVHVILFLIVFPNTYEDVVLRGNVKLYFNDSGRTLNGAVPYRDFLLEYPPGSLLFMMLPRLFAVGFLTYRSLFFAEVAILDVVVVVTLYASARAANLSALRVTLLYTLAMILLGPLVIYRLDLAPAALTALAVLAWQRDRPALAAAALAAGAGTKVYPILLLPPLIIDQWMQGRARRAPVAALAFVATLTVFLSPAVLTVLLAGPEGLLHALLFQTNRHLQVESIWATPPLVLHLTTGFPLQIMGRGRALVIFGPGDLWGQAGTPALALVALLIYAWWWHLRHRPQLRMTILLAGTAALVLAAATLSKVLSPQYLIWAAPVLALLPIRGRLAVVCLAAFIMALPLTQWIYPLHYGELVRWLLPAAVGVLALRNVLLVLALATLLAMLYHMGRNAGARHLVHQSVTAGW